MLGTTSDKGDGTWGTWEDAHDGNPQTVDIALGGAPGLAAAESGN
jgi:hypothetical protein